MILELKYAGFSLDEIWNMTFDQLEFFYRFARARYLESVASMTLAFHSKPKRFYSDLMRMIRDLERGGRKKVPFHDREKFKEYVKKLPGVIVETKQVGDIDGSN